MTAAALPDLLFKRQPSFGVAYALSTEKLAFADPMGFRLGVDEQAMSATFRVSSTQPDRVGDVVESQGIYLGNYEHNPIWLLNHASTALPIGKGKDPAGRLCVFPRAEETIATCFFSQKTKDAEQVFALVVEDILRATSIGFNPLEQPIPRRQSDANPNSIESGMLFRRIDLLEISVVCVPAAPQATLLRSHLSRGKIAGREIGDMLRKSLAPYAEPTPIWSPSGWSVLKGWVTLEPSGTHVYIDGDTGKISAGPANLSGKKPSELSDQRVGEQHGEHHPETGKPGPDGGKKPASGLPERQSEKKPELPKAVASAAGVQATLDAKPSSLPKSQPEPVLSDPKSKAGQEAKKVQSVLPSPAEWLKMVQDKFSDNSFMSRMEYEAARGNMAGICDQVSPMLVDYLKQKGVKAKVVMSDYKAPGHKGDEPHAWVQTDSGVIIDGSECQFTKGIQPGEITIYENQDQYEKRERKKPDGKEKRFRWPGWSVPHTKANHSDPAAARRARESDLVTFGADVQGGARCANCEYVGERKGEDYCENKGVDQALPDGREKMCCSRWDRPGTGRSQQESGAFAPASAPSAQSTPKSQPSPEDTAMSHKWGKTKPKRKQMDKKGKAMSESGGMEGGYAAAEKSPEDHERIKGDIGAVMEAHDTDGHEAHYKAESGEVHHTHPETANVETLKAIKEKMEGIDGVSAVHQHPEGPREEDGFEKVFPMEHPGDGEDVGAVEKAKKDARRKAQLANLLGRGRTVMRMKRFLPKKLKDALEECVQRKIPILHEEHGGEWDQDKIVAAAYGVCGESKAMDDEYINKDELDGDGDDDDQLAELNNPHPLEADTGTDADPLADPAAAAPEEEQPHSLELCQAAIENIEAALPGLEPEQRPFWEDILQQIRAHGEQRFPEEDFGGEEDSQDFDDPAVQAREQQITNEVLEQYRSAPTDRLKAARARNYARLAMYTKSVDEMDREHGDFVKAVADHLHKRSMSMVGKTYGPAHAKEDHEHARNLDRLHAIMDAKAVEAPPAPETEPPASKEPPVHEDEAPGDAESHVENEEIEKMLAKTLDDLTAARLDAQRSTQAATIFENTVYRTTGRKVAAN